MNKLEGFLLSIVLLCLCCMTSGQTRTGHDLIFTNISVQDGLSARRVYCIEQDEKGFLWFGTQDGLDRYDGYDIRIYRHEEGDDRSLSSSNIHCLLNDSKGRLWIGTSLGLDLYDPSEQDFTHVVIADDSGILLDNEAVKCLHEDQEGCLWIGTMEEGLVVYSPDSGECRHISFKGISGTGNRNIIRCINEDSSGNFWVGTFDGLFVFDKISWKPELVEVRLHGISSPENNLILSLMSDPEDSTRLWVGTETGLHLLDKDTRKFESYSKEIPGGLSANDIKCIEKFNDGRLMIGTHYGLNLFDSKERRTEVFLHNEPDRMSVASNVIRSIFRDRDENFWFATDNGVSAILSSRLEPHMYGADLVPVRGVVPENVVHRICFGTEGERYLSLGERVVSCNPDGTCEEIPFKDNAELMVRNLYVDYQGILWAATTKSLWYKEKSDQFFIPVIDPAIHYVNFMTADSKGNLWVDTFDGICRVSYGRNLNGKISIRHVDTVTLEAHLQDQPNISPMLMDSDDRLWGVALNRYLYLMDTSGDVLQEFDGRSADGESLWSEIFSCVEGNAIYILTDRGVYRFDEQSGELTAFLSHLPDSDPIRCATVDHYGNIWFATRYKLIRCEEDSGRINIFDLSDFLNDGIVRKSLQIDNDGCIWVGGFNKYLCFKPKENYEEKKHASPVISCLRVAGKSHEWRSIKGNLAEVRLRHDENSIEALYSLLDYESPASVQYSYILEGYEKRWTTVSGLNKVRYSNLSPGKYRFRLKAAFSNETWTDATEVQIHILPPWWLSWYSFLCYFLILSGIVYYLWHSAKIRIELKEKVRLEEFKRTTQEELIRYKVRYFTNISHEFRTPLTLIAGPLDMMLEKEKHGKMRNILQIMKNNTDRLLRMINQIMDFNKIELGSMRLHPSEMDLIQFLSKVHDLFLTEAESRNISYSFRKEWTSYYTSFDTDKLEKIVYNLLSNAFKYTPDGGSIIFSVFPCLFEDKVEGVEITVKDTGPGIPQSECTAIFERFYQSPCSEGSKGGTGIGLSLAKDYTDLFGGNIFTENNEGPGTTFHVRLPLVRIELPQPSVQEDEPEAFSGTENTRQTILVVDDNPEMCTFLQMSLQPEYKVIIAKNGDDGLQEARQCAPDIIISDLMMPGMDGMEFCRHIKEEEMTCHIPFLMLTAKDGDENIYAGLKGGADDYIPKPFNMKLLKVKIGKILSARDLMRVQLQRKFKFGDIPEGQEKNYSEDPFIDKLLNAIHEQISNETLDVGMLAEMLNMSKQQIYRKVKSLMGVSVVVLIRSVRMKEASFQLVSTDDTISEIMYRVGYTNTSYFSKCFCEQFGYSPSDYRKNYWKRRQ